jgi:signal transduction histidine kinase
MDSLSETGGFSAESLRAQPARAGRAARLLISLVLVAQVARTLTDENTQPYLTRYAWLMAVYLILFAIAGWRPRLPRGLLHAYLAVQSGLTIAMLAVNPEVDAVTAFFVPLAFQAALFFVGRTLWLWVGLLSLLTAGSLVFYLGALQGMALAMSPMAFIIALPALMVVNHETEIARLRSQAMLGELEETHRQLEAHAGQVEELASLQERSRLARELHDTVSQLVFSLTLTARSAQLLLRQDPALAHEQLERLRETSAGALGQLRSLISQMRP